MNANAHENAKPTNHAGWLQGIAPVFFILVAATFSTFPWSLHGMNWSDEAWYFNFGYKLLHEGAFPYRDYVLNVGFFAVLYDALLQLVFGSVYLASVFGGFFLKCAILIVIYASFRQSVGRLTAALAASSFAWFWPIVYNSSYFHADLLFAVAVLLLIYGAKTPGTDKLGKSSWFCFAGAGVSIALIFGARQSGLLCSVMLATTLVIHAIRERQYWRSMLLPTVIGFFAGLIFLALVLASFDALGPFIRQVFLDAGAKKSVGLTRTIIEFVTGGKYTFGGTAPWLIRYHVIT
ncbi:MAG: hypothetical protein V1754_07590, partial [Pseudomonadota bacterium]